MGTQRSTPAQRTEGDGVRSEFIEEHPSYGMLSICRGTGGSMSLYGSSIIHNETIRLSIHTSTRNRSLHRDWFHTDKVVVEVLMSPTQFADAITHLNHEGTPCTIRTRATGPVEHLPLPQYSDIQKEFRTEFAQDAQEAALDIDAAVKEFEELLEKPTIRKSEARAVLERLVHVRQTIAANMPFVLNQFHEQMEHTVKEAKGEVDAFVTRVVHETGLKALAAQQLTPNLIQEGYDGDPVDPKRDCMMLHVHKLPAHVRLSQHLREKSPFYLYIQSFGITFYIAATPAVRALFGVDTKANELKKPLSTRGLRYGWKDDALRDIVQSLELQVRDVIMAGIGEEVKQELFDKFDRLVSAPIQRRIGQLADEAEQKLMAKGNTDEPNQTI